MVCRAASLAVAALLLVTGIEQGAAQGTGMVVGRVVSAATGEPVDSVEVSVVGTSLQSLTVAEGWYVINGVPEGTYRVKASKAGYSPTIQEMQMAAGRGAMVEFALQPSLVILDELVVSGTGTAERRREMGNSLASVKSEQLETDGGVGLGTALQGRIAGLQVYSGGGHAGGGTILRLRGINSLLNNEPLVFLDGIRLGRISPSASEETSQVVSILDMLHPGDISRIEILRGSSATAIYGSEAASGVILIFSK